MGVGCPREGLWGHGVAVGMWSQFNDAACEWRVFTKGLLKTRVV